jgi:hypothetical protein
MSTLSRIIATILVAFVLGVTPALADSKSIQGTLLGTDGKPVPGADIKAERLDAKAAPAITKTDAQGRYVFKVLPVGAYAVTAYVKSVPKSRAMVKTRSDGWAKVDFDLRLKANGPDIKKRYVWVNGEAGSHIGGHWVEVDEAKRPSTSAVDTVGANDIDRMQRDMRLNNPAAMPGH